MLPLVLLVVLLLLLPPLLSVLLSPPLFPLPLPLPPLLLLLLPLLLMRPTTALIKETPRHGLRQTCHTKHLQTYRQNKSVLYLSIRLRKGGENQPFSPSASVFYTRSGVEWKVLPREG